MALVLIAVASYLVAATWLALDVRRAGDARSRGWLLPAGAALLLHAGTHLQAWQGLGATDLHFFAALSLVGLGMGALTTLVGAAGHTRLHFSRDETCIATSFSPPSPSPRRCRSTSAPRPGARARERP